MMIGLSDRMLSANAAISRIVDTSSKSDLQRQLTRRFRRHVGAHCYDLSGVGGGDVALYALTDPRDAQDIRYIGQTRAPPRRLLQHLNAARLWLPDETPWWVKSPKLRPLYTWIRELYRDEQRLPVMVIQSWVPLEQARIAERQRILELIAAGRPLLNVEREVLGRQLALL